nr:MAG: hypothetical protein 2 [Locarnavirus sp.]
MKIKSIANTFLYQNQSETYCPTCFEYIEDCTCFEEWDYSHPRLYKQSMPIVEAPSVAVSENEQTTGFTDEAEGMQLDIPQPADPISDGDQMDVASLAQFLSRPVRIHSFTWLESDASDLIKASIVPWRLFFNDARIKNKLNNFAFIRCKLKIKVLVNASPFYYGCMAMTYQPLTQFTPSTIDTGTGQQMLMPFSQRPITWIYPQHSQGTEMSLPFLYHKNWLDITSNNDCADMGSLIFINYTDLQSANGAVGQGVTIQVYAWAEEVELSGATVGLALQSQPVDEYGSGPISKPATTVAQMAARMKDIPVIGKFATATEIGARAVAGIATLFGYTNVPVINNILPFKPCAFPALASPEIGFPVEKLTLDPKNELTIDPSAVGAPPGDPLAIKSLVERESFIYRFNWDTTHAVDDLLFYSRVNPWMFRQTGNTINSKVDMTPLGMVSRLFEEWRGDLIFRMKIVASPYHKGRLIISFDPSNDPSNNLVNNTNVTSAVYTHIVDLGEDTDVEFRVPYVQALPFLRTAVTTGATPPHPFNTLYIPFGGTGSTFNAVKGLDNGCITIRVATNLTAPIASSAVRVLMYVRAADNFQLANPKALPQNVVSPFTVQSVPVMEMQSQPVPEEGQTQLVFGKAGATALPNQYRVNFGEVVSSLRVLLHRANYIYTQADPTANPTGTIAYRSTFGKLPPFVGFDPAGIQNGFGLLNTITPFAYNYVQTTPIQWILPCFIGYRGSGVWTFNPICSNPSDEVSVTRVPSVGMGWSDSIQSIATSTRSNAAYQGQLRDPTAGGIALTSQETQAGLAVLCPNYNNYRFNSTRPTNMTSPPSLSTPRTYDGAINDTFSMRITNTTGAQNTRIDKYWHAGPDFQTIFFINVPTYNYQGATPVPV